MSFEKIISNLTDVASTVNDDSDADKQAVVMLVIIGVSICGALYIGIPAAMGLMKSCFDSSKSENDSSRTPLNPTPNEEPVQSQEYKTFQSNDQNITFNSSV